MCPLYEFIYIPENILFVLVIEKHDLSERASETGLKTLANTPTLSFDTPIKPFSLVSMFVQEKNSIPNSSREDQSLMNQHLASATVTPSREECCAVICLAMAFTLHLGGAMSPLMVLMKSGLYLQYSNMNSEDLRSVLLRYFKKNSANIENPHSKRTQVELCQWHIAVLQAFTEDM